MKPIKICFVSLFIYPLFNPKVKAEFGGAELQLYYLSTELAKDPRFQVFLITSDFGQTDGEIRQGVEIRKLLGVKYTRTIIEYFKLWILLKKVNADIYFQRAAGMITCMIALFCKINKKKFLYMTAHDNDVIKSKKPSWFPRGILGKIIWYSFIIGLKFAHLVIVQHEQQKNNLKRFYKKDGLVRASAHKIQKVTDKTDKKFILWVARCEDWKQPELYLELAESIPKEIFVMVCPASIDNKLFKIIKERALEIPNLHFIDYVPFDKIGILFLKAKIFINTSKSEGFPNTFIQAANSKTPILSLNINPNNVIEKYAMGRHCQGDFTLLKDNLIELIRDKVLWSVMSENAYAYVKSSHDIEHIIEEDKKMIFNIIKDQ